MLGEASIFSNFKSILKSI